MLRLGFPLMVVPHVWVRNLELRGRAHAMSPTFMVLLSRDGVHQMFWHTDEK